MGRLLVIALVCLFSALPFFSAKAFEFSSESTEDKLDRLERSLNTLERQVYKGQAPSRNTNIDKPFEQEMETSGNNPEVRLSEIETKLRQLTGTVEELQFKQNELSEKLDKLLVGTPTAVSNATPSPPAPTVVPTADTGIPGGDGTRELGVIPLESAERAATIPAPAATTQPKDEYDAAFALLRQSKYQEATDAFKAFINKYPKDALVSNAYYWLGEAFYVQKDYEQASVAFLQGYQSEPKGNKAADNLLKLGIALDGLKKKKEACATFNKLDKEFPDMAQSIRSRLQKERERIGCK